MSVEVNCAAPLLPRAESRIFRSADMHFCEFGTVQTHVDIGIELSLITLVDGAWHAGE